MALILKKNQSTDLVSDKGTPVLNLTIGANWGMISKTGDSKAAGFFNRVASALGAGETVKTAVDLDLSMVFVNGKGEMVDMCYYGNKRLFSGAVQHSGDDLVGDDEQNEDDNELIKFDGMKVPFDVSTVYVVLNSFRHQMFDEIPYIGISFYEGLVNKGSKGLRFAEARVEKEKEAAGKECCILAKIVRTGKGWNVTPLFDYTSDTNLRDLARTAILKHG